MDFRDYVAVARDAIILLVSAVVLLTTVILYLKVSKLIDSATRTIKYTEEIT